MRIAVGEPVDDQGRLAPIEVRRAALTLAWGLVVSMLVVLVGAVGGFADRLPRFGDLLYAVDGLAVVPIGIAVLSSVVAGYWTFLNADVVSVDRRRVRVLREGSAAPIVSWLVPAVPVISVVIARGSLLTSVAVAVVLTAVMLGALEWLRRHWPLAGSVELQQREDPYAAGAFYRPGFAVSAVGVTMLIIATALFERQLSTEFLAWSVAAAAAGIATFTYLPQALTWAFEAPTREDRYWTPFALAAAVLVALAPQLPREPRTAWLSLVYVAPFVAIMEGWRRSRRRRLSR